MRKILVATDFSNDAAHAMLYALDLAVKTDAQIEVFHVLFPSQGSENAAYNAFWIEDYMNARKNALANWVDGYKKRKEYSHLSIKNSIQVGFPVPLICDKAEDDQVDLIVMGTHGATGFSGSVLGSVAAGVIARSKVPMVTVPKKSTLKEGSNLVLATDFRFRFADSSFSIIRDFLKMQNAKLKVVHINDIDKGKGHEKAELRLQERFEESHVDFHYLVDTDVVRAITHFAESVDASALVAVHHEHGLMHKVFYRSVSEELATNLSIPVIILPDTF